MNRKETIKQFINDENYVPMRKKDIAAVLGIPKTDMDELSAILSELESEGKIILSSKNRYIAVDSSDVVSGRFDATMRGFGFVCRDGEDDIFIPPDDTKGAMDGDTVLVRTAHTKSNDKRPEGKIIKIITHAHETVVGTYHKQRNFGFVTADDAKIGDDIFISKSHNSDAKDGQKVVVRITKWRDGDKKCEGEITEILGNAGDIGVDVLCVLRKYGISQEFPQTVIDEARSLTPGITDEEIKRREDFRRKTVITIDGADAKDLDDAVCVERADGGYELSVHIADVTHYVRENSPIDAEAFRRGTSVYFTDRVVPMLPVELSNNICSLNPHTDKLTLSAVMNISSDGELLSHRIVEGVISTAHRMTYENVEKILRGDSETCAEYADIKDNILLMRELADILKANRKKSGSIDFDFPETKIEVDKNGRPTNIYKYRTGASHGIIEEFMLMANRTVAEAFYWLEIPFIYRIHEKPSADKIANFNSFLVNMNMRIKGSEPHPMEFARMLAEIRGTDREMLISKVMLRSLMKAKYSESNEGHFGLAFRYYCHFTSPIRRYPDLAIHRIIKEYINGRLDDERAQHYAKFVSAAAEKSSEAEINAMQAEREVEDMKKAEYMCAHIGEEYDAIISSVTGFGFFAELENGIEGLVRLADMRDDYYHFNETSYTLIGEHSGKIYKIGDKVRIIVAAANPSLRQIDFYPAEQ